MPAHKITLEFEGTTGASGTAGARSGWSESWYDPSDTTDEVAESKAAVLAARRQLVLTTGWSLTSIRISRLDAANNLMRRGRLVFLAPSAQPGRYPGTNQDEQPYDALEVSVSSAGGLHRSFPLRGIGQNVVSAGGRFLNPGDFLAGFAQYSNYLMGVGFFGQGSPYALRVRTNVLGADPASNILQIVGVEIGPNAGRTGSPQQPVVLFAAGSNLAPLLPGMTIVIQRVLGMRRINASWKVAAISAGGPFVQLAPKRRVVVEGAYSSGGFSRVYAYSLDPLASMTPAYGTSRRTGRPLQLVRGRRSNRDL